MKNLAASTLDRGEQVSEAIIMCTKQFCDFLFYYAKNFTSGEFYENSFTIEYFENDKVNH